MNKNMAVISDTGKVLNIIVCNDDEPETKNLITYSQEQPAGIGYTYDEERDAFIPPQPYESWVLDEDTCLWVAPVVMPATGGPYMWDEDAGDWVEVTDV